MSVLSVTVLIAEVLRDVERCVGWWLGVEWVR